MAIIGEQFEDLGEYICGAVVNVRQKGDKVCQFSYTFSVALSFVDHYWLELLMAIIGEQFEDLGETYICGAVVNVRQKGDKVSLWTRDATRDDVNTRIGLVLKAKLDIPDSEPLYEVHKDSSVRTSSMVKPRIMIPNKEAAATAAR
ncbi:eukaryotic initiation factor 4E [Oesophagostomum dentatum]|uniref:Eukaryotic initiation factor 4E n=1 Tax=Oesophagostomum dentatum TaxID=61180 RepID=A0A0B1TJB1_OESDE|nr:eukaryotic initiation factor 4E [Oesophagostomum dentatum]